MNGMTRHAEVRCQQRGIPPIIVEWLLEFGQLGQTDTGEILYFNKISRKKICRYAGRQVVRKLDKYLDAYLVYSDGWIVTVGHRYKPILSN